MAHALEGYDGKCANIHGYSYELDVTLLGKPNSDSSSPKLGMVLDFSELKGIVRTEIIEPFDHALVLPNTSKEKYAGKLDTYTKMVWVPFQPTCEMLTEYFVGLLEGKLPDRVELVSLKLSETKSAFAEWYREDQLA